MPMESKAPSEKKHAYGGRQCSACGGNSCSISYEALRDMVEKKLMGGDGIGKGMEGHGLGHYAEGGKVGGAKTSTTGNKTKTGGSNPGGASTGGAGTVTITTGKLPPKSISVSGVGGTTESRNAGGMDPGDEEDEAMMAQGGVVEQDDAGMAYGPGSDSSIKRGEMLPLGRGRYADGGPVWVKDKYGNSTETHPAPSPSPDGEGDATKKRKMQMANAFGHAKGGEIEPMEDDADAPMDGDDDMLMDHCVGECMEALKSGDKAAFKDAMHTMMADMLSKMGKED